MFKAFARKKSVIITWFLSYLIVLVIPLAVNAFAFVQLQKVLTNQIETTNSLLLKQIAYNTDDAIKEIQRISSAVELNSNIINYTGLSHGDEKQKLYAMRQMRQDIAVYTSNVLPENMFVYLYISDMDMVVTHNAVYDSRNFYNFYIDKQQTFEQWKEEVSNCLNTTFYRARFNFKEDESSDARGYCKQVPFVEPGNKKITLFIMYNMDRYAADIQGVPFMHDGASTIIDKDDTNIFAINMDRFPGAQLKHDAYPGKSNIFVRKYGGRNVIVVYHTSELTGWKYVNFIPVKSFLEQSDHILYILLGTMVLALFVGTVMILYLVKKNYAPVENILQSLKVEESHRTNEFALITDTISKYMEEKLKLTSTLNRQRNIVKESYLSKLLLGQVDGNIPINEILQDVGVDFAFDSFVVVMICVESYDDFFEGDTQLTRIEKDNLVQLMFENVLEELIHEEYIGYVLPYGGNVFCIINHENIDVISVEKLVRYAQKIFDEHFEIQFSAAISDANQGYEGIFEGYNQVVDAISHRILLNDNDLILYRDISYQGDRFIPFEMDETVFNGLLKNGNSIVAKQYLDQMISRKINEENSSPKAMRYFCYEVINAFLHSITKNYCSIPEAMELQDRLMGAIDDKMTLDVCRTLFHSTIDSICENTGNQMQNNDIVRQIKLYIENNYANTNLNINAIADVFQLSSGYISNIFKKEENAGLLDFIWAVRINKAKKLLKETVMTVEEIYLNVGFTNKITFIRVFKKKEGMTPSQYRLLK